MRIIIIEDEKLAADRLKDLIQQYNPEFEIAAQIDSVKKSIDWLNKNKTPDLAFVDVELGDGRSFEIFDNISAKFPIIFTTAYNEYALQAFKLHSIDYLLKPISAAELSKAMDKFKIIGSSYKNINSGQLSDFKEIFNDTTKKKIYRKKGRSPSFHSCGYDQLLLQQRQDHFSSDIGEQKLYSRLHTGGTGTVIA